jgi:hypothetical protein
VEEFEDAIHGILGFTQNREKYKEKERKKEKALKYWSASAFEKRYVTVVKDVPKTDDTLQHHGIEDASDFLGVETTSQKRKDDYNQPYYKCKMNLNAGTIVLIRAYKDEDIKELEGEPPAFAETLYYQWTKAAQRAKKDTKELPLKQIIIHQVLEPGTRSSIDDIKPNKKDISSDFRLSFAKPETETKESDYEKILKTAFGRAVQRFLSKVDPKESKHVSSIDLQIKEYNTYHLTFHIS